MMIIEILKEVLWVTIFDIIAQWFWITGICVLLYAFIQRDDIRTKQLVTIALVAWMWHYLLLEMTWAVYATLIALLRMYFSLKHKWNKYALAFVFFLTALFWYISYDWVISVLPILASVIAILAYLVFNWLTMRISLLIVSFLWLYYMIMQQSIPWIVNEVLSEIILVITIVKIYLDEHKELSLSQTFVQKIKYILQARKVRKRRDFWRFMIFRDRKKYLEENNIVYED